MKQTSDKAIFRLLHMPTSESVDWVMSRHAVPAVDYLEERIDIKRKEYLEYLEVEEIDLQKNPDMDADTAIKIHNYSREIIRLKMDALSCVLDLHETESVPDGYANKREYLEDCIGELGIIQEMLNFFSEHYGNSISRPEPSQPYLQILDQAGKPWESNSTKG